MRVSFAAARLAAIAVFVACASGCGGPQITGATHATTRPPSSTTSPSPASPSQALLGGTAPKAARALPRTLYGVTVDDVSNLSDIVASAQHLPQMPVTRV